MTDLAQLDREGLGLLMERLGARPFHARQLYRWLYGRRVGEPESMTDLPLGLRERLARETRLGFPAVIDRVASSDGTIRYVYGLEDGFKTESVFIPGAEGRATLCLSSQVGCALACRFCLSGVHGLRRHLTPAEIVGQAWHMLRESAPLTRTNIVFMGIGEPLDNFSGLQEALRHLTDPEGFRIAIRRITVSSAGLVPGIERLAALQNRPRLAISLNATTDAVRDRLMPINKRWPLARLMECLAGFPLRRGERITFEYVLLAGVNDSDQDAARFGRLLGGIPSKINVIPWNSSAVLGFSSPTPERVDRFAGLLCRFDAAVTVRRSRGDDASAACGQLSIQPREESRGGQADTLVADA